MVEKIVSGGQTGVDQAALHAAENMGIPIGGWCPRGGKDENGKSILNLYPFFKESPTENPDERTRLNIEHSDGTLILVPELPIPSKIKDGTLLTIEYAKQKCKPTLIVAVNDFEKYHLINQWVRENNIRVLNVAGPRESSWPGIYDSARQFFEGCFSALRMRSKL